MAGKGVSKPVVDKLNAALKASLKDTEFIKRQEALGAVVMTDASQHGRAQKIRGNPDQQTEHGHRSGGTVRRLRTATGQPTHRKRPPSGGLFFTALQLKGQKIPASESQTTTQVHHPHVDKL